MNSRPEGISVVVPTARRPAALRRCVEALQASEPPGVAVELIVIDDGSEPRVDADALPASPYPLQVHWQTNAGPAAARNHGARRAGYRWLAFTDDDCRPTPDWLGRMVEALRRQPEALVGGYTRNAVSGSLPTEASQMLTDFLYQRQARSGQTIAFFTSNNLAVGAEAFAAVGGFDAAYRRAAGEDRALGRSWRRSGRPIVYLPEAVVEHEHRMGLGRFWRQQSNYGRGAYTFHRSAAGSNASAEEVESPTPRRFYLELLSYPLRTRRLPRSLPLAVLAGLSQVAVTAGYFAQRREDRRAKRVNDRGEST